MSQKIIVEQDVTIPLRDGTHTKADIFRLDDDVRRPVILQRSIYGKQGYMEHAYAGPMNIVRAGYVYVSQDCRGCGESDGYLEFFFQEQEDGYDSVEWAAEQPWSNGKVGIVGNSALTMTALQAVAAQPPSLAAAFVVDGHTDMETWTKRGGVPSEVYFGAQFIPHMVALNNLKRLDLDADGRAELERNVASALSATREDLLHLPVLNFEGLKDDRVTSGLHRIFLAEPTDPLWKKDSTALGKEPERARVPIKAVAGLYAPFVGSMANVWSANPDIGHELIIGPWGHFGTVGAPTGVRNYLEAPAGGRKAWWSAMIAWFDQWMKDEPSPEGSRRSKLYYFLPGENRWAASYTWPPSGSDLDLFLNGASSSAMSSDSRVGALDFELAAESSSHTYIYDPANPAPTVGGVVIDIGQLARFDSTLTADGPHDQRRLETREDVLIYDSPVLDDVVRVVGSASATIWASSSAEDTDFIVRLIDVEPDGFAAKLAEGVIRTRYRHGTNDSWLTPGEPVELNVELDPVVHSFMPGHRVRVHITSSSFPKYARNLNSRVVPELGVETDIVVARQSVHHGPDMSSRITLHIVPAVESESPYDLSSSPRPAELDDSRAR
ncbi:CocE/NonD family hydrolase [Rhodococcus sp. T2V]|uniref:CocE/NonD family hydrolase n=1 Tax=Rhodococcus sp. T2V TaxID=3034164 RepID=UPI0023E34673|nr:CocE/NonD family hydrolase [Rhodococcus sp. T2V]MDF3312205.1 CocE/NonD family hydrolase [Rhodococcus sp. T2V]